VSLVGQANLQNSQIPAHKHLLRGHKWPAPCTFHNTVCGLLTKICLIKDSQKVDNNNMYFWTEVCTKPAIFIVHTTSIWHKPILLHKCQQALYNSFGCVHHSTDKKTSAISCFIIKPYDSFITVKNKSPTSFL
jgi:hypothetical protein